MTRHLLLRSAALILIVLAPGCNPEQTPPAPSAPPAAEAAKTPARPRAAERAQALQRPSIVLKVQFDGLVALVTEGPDKTKPSLVTAMAVKASQAGDRVNLPKAAEFFKTPVPLHSAYLRIKTKNLNPALPVGDADTLIKLDNDDVTIPALGGGSGVTMTDPNLALVPHLQAISEHGKVSGQCFTSNSFAQKRVAARLQFASGSLTTMGPVVNPLCPTRPVLFNYVSLKDKVGKPGATVAVSSQPAAQLHGGTVLTASVPGNQVDITVKSFKDANAAATTISLQPAPGENEIVVSLLDLPAAEILGQAMEGDPNDAWVSHFIWFYTLAEGGPAPYPVPHVSQPPCGHGDPYCSGGLMVR